MNKFKIIAGPCSVESEEMLRKIYQEISADIDIFRGGAFKPRSSVHSFQGLGGTGLDYLRTVSELPIASEIVDFADFELFAGIEYIQIGARNMQNFALLKKIGETKSKVILKRGLSSTLTEWLQAAEYLQTYGATEVILCERGIRSYSDSSRFMVDFAGVIKLKQTTDYQVIVDVSHPAGDRKLIADLARSVAAIGCDGIMIEVHNQPQSALSDADQQLDIAAFKILAPQLRTINKMVNELKN